VTQLFLKLTPTNGLTTSHQRVGSRMKAGFGTLSGDFIYVLAAVLGLAAILSAHPGVLKSA
jgi:threonine/homoserine/homoserine lactone efflux protein